MKRLLLSSVLLSVLLPVVAHAQWVRMNGPFLPYDGGSVSDFTSTQNWLGESLVFASMPGKGIFLSSNGGRVWRQVTHGLPTNSVNALTSIDTLIFAATDAGISVSADLGQRWSAGGTGLPSGAVRAVDAIPGKTGGINLFASVPPNRVYRSTDTGITWQQVCTCGGYEGMLSFTYSLDQNGQLAIFGDGDWLFTSSNDGQSWTGIRNDPDFGCVYRFVGASNGSTVYTGASAKGVWSSTDNGQTWLKRNTGLNNGLIRSIAAIGSDVYTATRNALFASHNNAELWTRVGANIPDTVITRLYAYYDSDGNVQVLAGTQQKGIYRSSDRGITWEEANAGIMPVDVSAVATMQNESGKRIILACVTGISPVMYRSSDWGTAWELVSGGLPELRYGSKFSLETGVTESGEEIAFFLGEGLYRSSNRGLVWEELKGNFQSHNLSFLVMSEKENGGFNIVTNSKMDTIQISSNYGYDWVNVRPNIPTWRFIRSIAASKEFVIACTDLGLHYSNDGGFTWALLHNLVFSNLLGIAPRSDGTRAVFTFNNETGLSITTDMGSNWYPAEFNIYPITINSFGFYTTNVFAGTSKGVFVTSDYGQTWEGINEGFGEFSGGSAPNIRALRVSDGYLLAATDSYGLWTRPLSEVVVSAAQPPAPSSLSLAQSYPNPVVSGATATIPYTLERQGYVSLKVYDALGRLVATLADGPAEPGPHRAQLVAANLSPGIYLYRLHSDGAVMERKMVVMR